MASIIRRAAQLILGEKAKSGKAQLDRAFFWNSGGARNSFILDSGGTKMDYMESIKKGLEANTIIASAVMYKIRAVSQVIATLDRISQNTDPIPENHVLAPLVESPNPIQSWADFNGFLVACLNLSGNGYIYIERETNGEPKNLYCLRPDKMRIVFGEYGIDGFVYKGKSMGDDIILLPEDVIHIKFPNPSDEYNGLGYGLSPISSIARVIKVDNFVSSFLENFFQNGAIPPAVLKVKHALEENDALMIKQRWREIYGGVNSWADVGVLDQDVDFEKIGFSFSELGVEAIDKRNEVRILSVFGVSPILVGSSVGLENSTFSNYEEARTSFWQDTMLYEVNLISEALKSKVMSNSKDDVRLTLSTSKVFAFSADKTAMITNAQTLTQMGVPLNIAFEIVGLVVPEFDGIDGNVKNQKENNNDVSNKKSLKNIKTFRKPEYVRTISKDVKKKARELNVSIENLKPQWDIAAVNAFLVNRRNVLAVIGAQAEKSIQTKSSTNWDDIEDDIEEYFKGEAITDWQKAFYPVVSGTFSTVTDTWNVLLGTSFNLRHVYSEEFIANHTFRFAQPANETTLESIRKMLLQAQEEGWSIGKTQSEISRHFSDILSGKVPGLSSDDSEFVGTRLTPSRLEMIARTELTKAANAGSQKLFRTLGVQKKQWLTSIDGRERASHASANGQTVEIDKPFMVGGFQMMHPGDMNLGAPVKEIVNCRCTTIPLIEETTLDSYSRYDDKLAPEIAPEYSNAQSFLLASYLTNPKTGSIEIQSYNVNSTDVKEREILFQVSSEKSKAFFGKDVTPEEIARIAGVPHDFRGTISISYESDGKSIIIKANGDGFDSLVRKITKGEGSRLILSNVEFFLEPSTTGKGIGIKVFTQQVYYARQNGIAEIVTTAANGPGRNGYYTWARFGYDALLDKPVKINGVQVSTVSELMSIPGGAEWWKKNGYEFEGIFNLGNGSTSMNVFTSYIDKKNKRGQKFIALASDTDIELTESDEQILNSVWLNLSSLSSFSKTF